MSETFGKKCQPDLFERDRQNDIRRFSDMAIGYAERQDNSGKKKNELWSLDVALNRVPALRDFGLEDEVLADVKQKIKDEHRHMKANIVASKIFGRAIKARRTD